MTSSLVGSEMCIRDRSAPEGTGCPTEALHWARLGPVQSLHQQLQSALPVSYTHLTLPTICSV
eukprot:6514388-Prorocentrum_lima.AAC.1